MQFIGIIPARYDSMRFPGKPLANIGGKTMIQRVYEQALKALECVYVATDDERIVENVASFKGRVVLTSKKHRSGTDRCSEAIQVIQETESGKHFDVVINVQGDEPFIKPEQLHLLMGCFDDNSVQIATLVKQITENEDIFNPNIVKVIRNKESQALYFSRSPIPYLRNEDKENWKNAYPFFKHIGIYAYKIKTLRQLTMLKPSPLEIAESLEQNRWLENGYSIVAETTKFDTIAIDTPEDIDKIKHLI